MKRDILIGFEESQTVCMAFRAFGHNAYSCDIKPCSGGYPEYHLQMDIFEAIKLRKWYFIGLHPTCTAMALSGNRHYAFGKPKHTERLAAVKWTLEVWELAKSNSMCGYMENPMGALNSAPELPKPQIIHPYYFGDEFQKTTCLWLYNLPPLLHSSTPPLILYSSLKLMLIKAKWLNITVEKLCQNGMQKHGKKNLLKEQNYDLRPSQALQMLWLLNGLK